MEGSWFLVCSYINCMVAKRTEKQWERRCKNEKANVSEIINRKTWICVTTQQKTLAWCLTALKRQFLKHLWTFNWFGRCYRAVSIKCLNTTVSLIDLIFQKKNMGKLFAISKVIFAYRSIHIRMGKLIPIAVCMASCGMQAVMCKQVCWMLLLQETDASKCASGVRRGVWGG